jgi:hypothetical protein
MNLKSIQLAVVKTVQTVSQNISLYTTTGWGNSTVFSLQWAFTQDKAYYAYGGTAGSGTYFSTSSYQNSAAYAQIYDQYRICKVELDFYWNCNFSNITQPGISLPMIYAVIDYDDGNALASAVNALGYSSCRVIQLGNNQFTGGKSTITLTKPTVQGVVNTTSFLNTNVAGRLTPSPWLDTDYTNIEHNSIKLYYENPIGTTQANIGEVTFVICQYMEYKNVK